MQGALGGLAAQGVGDTLLDGDSGELSQRVSATVGASGRGGKAPIAGSGGREVVAQGAGSAGGFPGGGGSGGASLNAGASVAGGAGADGLIRVWEFG